MKYILEQFPKRLGKLLAVSANSHGHVNSYLVKRGGRKVHGYWSEATQSYIES